VFSSRSASSDFAADAKQAAYFRAVLVAHRAQVSDSILKRRALIERRGYASRLRADVHEAEAEVRQLDWLIAGIDRRFSAHWASSELAL
jgi:hypothetical protein